ncbi:Na+/melibiose symporter-like transporter [Mycoplasmopsis mustelae]|uniref:Na+/melibiose symporter-like transporter n=1 Tax=Mycoplasmopsis mustelae TaxID=171289 RepID=A0A4R7UET2_9BACT|nr:MFS transporter [Mycoplasmopsis mustelae]TDV24393.1 Na+/melibiose symporter-like transporter [Mycoplasmopsis mustelae]
MLDKLKGLTWKQIVALIILAAADVFVIAAPYYIKNIIPNLHLYLNIREDQVATLTSIIGYVTLITQLPGGFLANKFSSKVLLFIAVFSTGLITFWFGGVIWYSSSLNPNNLFIQYSIIFGLWGVSSTLVFWTPLWKLVSQQTTKENQGLAYGIQGTANGLIGLLFVFFIGILITTYWVPIYDKVAVGLNKNVPFAVYAFLIASFLMVTSVMVLTLVPEKWIEKSTEKLTWERFKKSIIQVWNASKNWKLWALSIFVMGMYTFQSVFAYYLVQLMQNAYLAPVILVTILGGVRSYGLRTLISTFVGRWADKFRSYILFLIITTFIGIIILGAIILFGFIPNKYNIWVIVLSSILFICAGILSWVMVTLRYTQIGEIHLEKNSYASSVGILSFIGFSTDAWLYQITGAIGSKYTEVGGKNTSATGYQIILVVCLAVAIIGLLAGLIVHISNTKELKKLGKTNYRWRTLENE